MTAHPFEADAGLDRLVSENVNTLLLRARMSRRALALSAGGLSHAALNRKITGETPWALSEAARVASALEVTLLELTTDLPSYEEWQARWDLRARRDSNPKPSDLYPRRLRLVVDRRSA